MIHSPSSAFTLFYSGKGVGCELKQRGHRVTVLGIEDVQSKVIATGLEFQTIGRSDFSPGATKKLFTQLGKLKGLDAIKYSIEWMAIAAKVILRDTPEVVKATGIEALLIDQASPEGGTVAEYLDIPFISICSAIVLNLDPSVPPFLTSWKYDPSWRGLLRNQLSYTLLSQIGKPITKIVRSYRQQWNLPPTDGGHDGYSTLAQISQQPSSFEFPRQKLPACFHFTSSFSNNASRASAYFPYEKLTGQPLIYASLGTVQNRLMWLFKAIAKACVGLDAQLVIALGGGTSPDSFPELPGKPIVVGYAPQLELLQRATLTITHAGMNTTLESLDHGVPMVAIPITNDQPGVAARIAWTGTGEVVALKKVSVERLKKAIAKVLSDETYRTNALKLQRSMKQGGGVGKAADIIEQAVATRKPVLN